MEPVEQEQGDEQEKAMSRALGYLGYKARTESEMAQYLEKCGFSPEVGEAVVARLCELGYLDDEKYIAAFIEARARQTGHAKSRIRGDLRRRGLDRDSVELALDDLDSSYDQSAAVATASKLKRRYLGCDSATRRRRMLSALVRRGFDYGVAMSAISAVEDAEPPDGSVLDAV